MKIDSTKISTISSAPIASTKPGQTFVAKRLLRRASGMDQPSRVGVAPISARVSAASPPRISAMLS